ncbi:MAG: hypothetical protein RLN88_13630 [Ekhidna sp.]|uniref:hypothetical protein n=1 Tax=Ekhidna sp. TaxID=2608089 RepID=UPI0032EE5C82
MRRFLILLLFFASFMVLGQEYKDLGLSIDKWVAHPYGFLGNDTYIIEPTIGSLKLINEDSIENEISIWPIPSQGIIHIEGMIDMLSIYDSKGTLLMTDVEPGIIDLSSLRSGVYYLRNHSGFVKKIVLL